MPQLKWHALRARRLHAQGTRRDARLRGSESLKRSGDFFAKFIVVNGYQRPMTDQDGIVTVGLIPFLLESAILDGGLAAKRNMEVPTVG